MSAQFTHGHALVVSAGADLPVTATDAAAVATLLRVWARRFFRVAEEIGGRRVDEIFEAWFYREQVPDIPELSLSMGN